jgi:transketolase
VEHLWALRAIPGLDVVRPGDANETAVAWRTILEHDDRPAGLILSRQALPTLDRETFASAEGTARGAYVVAEGTADHTSVSVSHVILIATGSEVSIAVEAREILEAEGISTRVVSMPCREWFEAQGPAYRDEILPPGIRARVSIEAGVSMGWREFVGDAGRIVSIDHYGASADAATLFREFGFTPAAVVAAAQESIRSAAGQGTGGE